MDKIFRAMADKNRRKILTLLKESGELSVNQLLKGFTISQGTLSTHLSVLRKTKLVNCRVVGKQRIYSIEKEILKSFIMELNRFGDVSDALSLGDVIQRR